MRESHRSSVARGGALAAALAAILCPSAAHAQYIHNDAPPLPIAPLAGAYESPTDKLSRNVRVLAQQPNNFPALIEAGRASLAMGDLPSAEGFFARADEVNPNNPAPKIGMAGAAVLSGNLDEAQNWFGQAQRLGASQSMLGADRGMMLDLKGDLGSAQSDYRAGLAGPDPDEDRRRFALSLGMGGRMDEALKMLEPLLRNRDPAALRVRAFVLALGGQRQAAATAIEQAMPGSGSRMAPFFDSLAVLNVQQKAAAVHLGIFPSAAEVRLAQAQAVAAPPAAAPVSAPASAPPVKVASRRERPPKTVRGKDYTVEYKPTVTYTPTVQTAQAQPPVAAPVQVPVQAPIETPAPASTQVAELPQPGFSLPSGVVSAPAQNVAMAGDRLSGIDKLLGETLPEPLPPPPPPPRPKVETAKAKPSAADTKAAAAKKAADAKAKADADAKKKADAEAKAIGVSGSTWVQLAGGSNEARMAAEFKRIKARKPDLFAKRSGYVTQGKDYFRLLVGPFSDSGDARDFVNALAKAGIDSFMWNRSPPTIRIEKLPSK
jgi:tetratricopeptide (TPR) repeat protein